MLHKNVQVERPDRWDVPFDESTTAATVDRILDIEPFASMDAERFPSCCSLRGLLQNDTRVRKFAEGDLLVRQGDYGNSAFLILSGSVRVTLDDLPDDLLGRGTHKRSNLLTTLARMLFRSRVPEFRRQITDIPKDLGYRKSGDQTNIFLQDVPGVLDQYRTLRIMRGSFFGEVAALSRTPRSASVFADSNAEILEIRWQGLRDLMRYDHALRDHIHALYRSNSLLTHLRQTPFLQKLNDAQMETLVEQTSFETYGDFEWHRPYRELAAATANERINAEPVIAAEGNTPNGLLLIRNGFARLSQHYGHGHRTCSYLGKGQSFGLAELFHQWKHNRRVRLQHSLRAVGYVDILRIPTELVEELVLPNLDEDQTQKLLSMPESSMTLESEAPCNEGSVKKTATRDGNSGGTATVNALETSMLEFVVENRLMNGAQAMLIDLDRCTRCDDCVRACSDTHDNNPRFVRQGPVFGRQMFASACMHCADPVCMIGCPTGAISRNEESGNVTIHDGTCIGCGTCANSCPYQTIRMVDIRDKTGRVVVDRSTHLPIAKATKCDLCTGLLGGPACERACSHDALVRIDLRDPSELQDWLTRNQ